MTLAALVAGLPLRMGSFGDAVRLAQLALKSAGYPLTGTGYFGQATDTAVEEAQRKAGLPVTGLIDLATAKMLDDLAPKSVTGAPPLRLAVSLAHMGLKEGPGQRTMPSSSLTSRQWLRIISTMLHHGVRSGFRSVCQRPARSRRASHCGRCRTATPRTSRS